MKKIKRFLITVLLLFIVYAVINYNTGFFINISESIPYLGKNHSEIAESISRHSKKLNAAISKIPTPLELIARFQNKELPIDPEDIAENIYYSSDTMLNFYAHRNISVAIENGTLDVYGITDKASDKYLVYRFLDDSGETLRQDTDVCDSDGEFRKQMTIPEGTYQFTIFTGPEQYGEYISTVYDYILLEKSSDSIWQIKKSPVFDNNVAKYEKAKSKSAALADTYDVCHSKESIVTLANSITDGIEKDYDKALAIHDWVCNNIFYDTDSIDGLSNNAHYIATDVLNSRRAVCLGYSNLYAALCRSIGIPCNVVTGYALGVGSGATTWNEVNSTTSEANHAWNEVYLDNRWVIVDTTWDSKNKIEDNVGYKDEDISHLYFDANLKFFSANHRIDEYLK